MSVFDTSPTNGGGQFDLMTKLLAGSGNPSGLPDSPTGDFNFGNDSILPDLSGLGNMGQGLAGLFSAWAGLQGVKLGKDQLDFTKASTNRNLENQAKTTNAALADRQGQRVSAGRGANQYQSVADYMANNGVNGGAI